MRYEGRWIVGANGARRVVAVAQTLNEKSLALVNQSFETDFRTYRPWMSCLNRHKYFLNSEFAKSPYDKTRFISDPEELKFLDEAFRSVEAPLWYLQRTEPNDMCVELEDRARVEATEDLMNSAIAWLSALDDSFQTRIEGLLFEIIPLGLGSSGRKRSKEGRGLSSHFYRGGIFVDLPETNEAKERLVETTINLAHEVGHQTLIVYQNADPILTSSLTTPVYSPIRKTNRPAIKSFHAVVALALMGEFVSLAISQRGEPLAYLTSRASQISEELELGVNALRAAGVTFTELGGRIVEDCESVAGKLKNLLAP